MDNLFCTNCKNPISPVHHIGEDYPPLRCGNCDPSTHFTRFYWDGETWRCAQAPHDYTTKEIREYLSKLGVRCQRVTRDRLLAILRDIERDPSRLNKYVPTEKKVHGTYKVRLEDGEVFVKI